MAVTAEILIPRLGEVLVEQGKITPEQLQQALFFQEEERAKGNFPLIGQVIVKMGFLDQETLNQSVIQQVIILQNNLKMANATLERRVQERTAELEIAYQKLSELSTLKANFVSNISHELRTPLTHVNGYVDLLLSDEFTPLSTDQKSYVEVIKRAAQRLEHLIDDLILFSTFETNRFVVTEEPCNPAQIIEEAVNRVREAANKKNILIHRELPDDLEIIYCDKNKIFWVLNHLIENAIKFTPAGGEISLRLRIGSEADTFEVADNGNGIDPQRLDEIFEPFHQLDESSTRAQGGTGLGLALAKKIIEAHNSKLKVNSIPGKGSTFSFSLSKIEIN